MAQRRLYALIRIRRYHSNLQAQTLASSFIFSQFKYCNLVWMFCAKPENSRIDKIHKRVLRCVYNSTGNLELDEFLSQYHESSIHVQNLQSLMTLVYRVLTGNCPKVASDLFNQKKHKLQFTLKLFGETIESQID